MSFRGSPVADEIVSATGRCLCGWELPHGLLTLTTARATELAAKGQRPTTGDDVPDTMAAYYCPRCLTAHIEGRTTNTAAVARARDAQGAS